MRHEEAIAKIEKALEKEDRAVDIIEFHYLGELTVKPAELYIISPFYTVPYEINIVLPSQTLARVLSEDSFPMYSTTPHTTFSFREILKPYSYLRVYVYKLKL